MLFALIYVCGLSEKFVETINFFNEKNAIKINISAVSKIIQGQIDKIVSKCVQNYVFYNLFRAPP